jgi:hypothetical protein
MFLKSKLNSFQQGFAKSKSTIINLVSIFDFVTHLFVHTQADAVYSDISNAVILVHMHYLSRISPAYWNWFRS